MSEREDTEGAAAKPDAKSGLSHVESPSISPATPEKSETAAPIEMSAPAEAQPNAPWFAGLSQHKQAALFAASIAGAIAFGALIGAFASGGFAPQLPHKDAAGLEEREAMEKSIAQLSREISTLKTSIETASKSATTQIAKTATRVEQVPETTGSVPIPREAPRNLDAQPAKPAVLQDWSIRYTRNGYVYVEWRGEVYEVMPGIPLPGIGHVETVKRQDGRLVVVTPKGLIVAQRDRDYFAR